MDERGLDSSVEEEWGEERKARRGSRRGILREPVEGGKPATSFSFGP